LQDLLELAVGATASGCIYGLIALAYLLMIRPTGIINFAVGEWAMVGGVRRHLSAFAIRVALRPRHGGGDRLA
jgi:branched-chain amino acid transport system permease protein